ncbi:hypothetical protein CA54_05730 [Symmachiella macrocystis]|uniref:Uncharacterized protein n=1 Tax=Symmachiella macrocystis TaxID=2527985 RepID=A0A5C6BMM5_9PLAN|nr:hypothetical protein CA54_05730 [Symmachiella macrocystis]
MAFVVCYSKSLSDHVKNGAIYLDQRFYELIFRYCRSEGSGFTVLRQVALLRYKSPTILLSTKQIPCLVDELERLEQANHTHPQILGLKDVSKTAMQTGYALSVSGDMYPELDGSLV